MNKQRYLLLILAVCASLLLVSCPDGNDDDDDGPCVAGIDSYFPTSKSVSLDKGKAQDFSVEGRVCDGSEQYSYRYYLSDAAAEGTEVSQKNNYSFLACAEGGATAELVAEVTDASGRVYKVSWRIHVSDAEPVRPECYNSSIETIKSGELKNFRAAVDCLHDWTIVYGCDAEPHFAAGLGEGVIFGLRAEERVMDRKTLDEGEAFRIFTEEIDKIHKHLEFAYRLITASSDPTEFSFEINYLILEIFSGKMDGIFAPIFTLDLAAEWDYTDITMMYGALNYITMIGEFMRAYEGTVDFFRTIPNEWNIVTPLRWGGTPDPTVFYFENEFFKFLDENPKAMTLRGEDGEIGKALMKSAKQHILDSSELMQKAFDLVRAETDDQSNDFFRYWDCGPDGICPGDPAEPIEHGAYDDKNNNNSCDPSYDSVGKDPGEGNGRYDNGELVGLIGMMVGRTIRLDNVDLPTGEEVPDPVQDDIQSETIIYRQIDSMWSTSWDLDEFKYLIDTFIHYVRTDEPLVPDRFLVPLLGDRYADTKFENSLVWLMVRTFGIPVPYIRISSFFDNPTDQRNFFPAYAKKEVDGVMYYYAYFEREHEAFRDIGLDWAENDDEEYYCSTTAETELAGYDSADAAGKAALEAKWQYCVDMWPEGDVCTFCNFSHTHPDGTVYRFTQQSEITLKSLDDFSGDNNFSDNTACAATGYQGVDNDWDGTPDDLTGGTLPGQKQCDDNGPDRNMRFDYLDIYDSSCVPDESKGADRCAHCSANPNGSQDLCDPHEPFSDAGIGSDAQMIKFAGNGLRDAADSAHTWPEIYHATIETPTRDPRDGLPKDDGGELIDAYYFFIPDSTFSGTLRFEEEMINGDGETLNDNASLMRFFWKTQQQFSMMTEWFVSTGDIDPTDYDDDAATHCGE